MRREMKVISLIENEDVDTIVSVISIQELTFQGMELMSATFLTFEIWFTIAAIYLVITVTLSFLVSIMESRLKIET